MRLDLHVHSAFSPDGQGSPEAIVRAARARGLGGLAVVDHNTVEGARRAAAAAKELGGLVVVRGIEVTTAAGHVLALGVDADVPRGLPPEDTVERVRALGGIAVAAHPYRFWSGLGEAVVARVRFDAVEAHNGRSLRAHNERARRLAERLRLPATGGSDAHAPREVGRGVTEVEGDPGGEGEVIEAIVAGRTRGAGAHRGLPETLRYTAKCVGEWLTRGMRRM